MYTHLLSWRISSNESEETFRLSWLRSQNSGILYLPPFQYERRKKLTWRLASNWRFHSTAKDVSLSLSFSIFPTQTFVCVEEIHPQVESSSTHFPRMKRRMQMGQIFFLNAKALIFFFFTHQQWKERECWCLWKVNWKIENGKMRKIWMRPLPFKTWVIYVLLYFSFGQHSCCLFVPVWWETWKKRRKKMKSSFFFLLSSETPGIRWKYHRRKKLAIRGYRSSRHFNSGVKRTRTYAAKENGWNKNSCVANGSRK